MAPYSRAVLQVVKKRDLKNKTRRYYSWIYKFMQFLGVLSFRILQSKAQKKVRLGGQGIEDLTPDRTGKFLFCIRRGLVVQSGLLIYQQVGRSAGCRTVLRPLPC